MEEGRPNRGMLRHLRALRNVVRCLTELPVYVYRQKIYWEVRVGNNRLAPGNTDAHSWYELCTYIRGLTAGLHLGRESIRRGK